MEGGGDMLACAAAAAGSPSRRKKIWAEFAGEIRSFQDFQRELDLCCKSCGK